MRTSSKFFELQIIRIINTFEKKELFKDFAHLQIIFNFKCRDFNRGGFRGGGGGDAFLLQGFDPCRPKGSPLHTILRCSFLVTDTKNFPKAASVPIYTNFVG